MAEFNRSLSIPAEVRTRSRTTHVSCPRCRVDPSHISRQFWDAPARPVLDNTTNPNNSHLVERGYPDLCRRSNRSYTSPASVHHQYQNTRYHNNGRYDAHSTRSAGDTWRIRGILENHPPDVARRPESGIGRLPDVTHNTIQHARTRSVPVGGTYDARLAYDVPHQPPRSSIICARSHQDGLQHTNLPTTIVCNNNSVITPASVVPQRREPPPPLKPPPSPWVTRNDEQWSQQQQQQQPHNGCWRPSTVATTSPSNNTNNSNNSNVLPQCPLPDLVTPRRQARKQCCGLLATHSVAIRWLVVVIAVLGLLCSVVGTIVGVVKATGKEHLTVALLLIALGIILVSMSGIAWRLTSRESPSCRAMFGFRRTRHEPHRRFVPRVPQYGRPHPFSAMLYPDITLRPPPPSYQASMQEYRLRLLLMDRQSPPVTHQPPPQPPPPPPPMYRGPATVYSRFPLNPGISDYSRPPSYRSRPSSVGQPSPVGPEDVELINNSSTSSSHLPSDVISSLTGISSSASQNAGRSAPSLGATNNHVEVVAEV